MWCTQQISGFITAMTSWVDKVQIYFPTFPFTATTSQQQIYFQLKCESQLSDALLLPFGRTFFSEDFKFLNKTHSQPDWKVFWTFFLEDFKFLNTPWRKHTISNTKVILICILLSNSLLRTFCLLSDSLNKRRLLSMMHLLGAPNYPEKPNSPCSTRSQRKDRHGEVAKDKLDFFSQSTTS